MKKDLKQVMKQLMDEEADYFVKNTLMDNFLKLARVNILTGEYQFLKYDTVMREEGYENIPSIYSYIEKQVADDLVMTEYAQDYQRYADPEYVQKRIFESGDRRIIQSYMRRTQHDYIWVTFGIVVPENVSMDEPWALFYWQRADSNTTTMVDALSTLSEIYYKILKINLTDDTFRIIKTDPAERRQFADCLTKISDWWKQFETEGYVYSDDTELFRTFTDIDRLRKRFCEEPDAMESCRYRRKIGDDWRWVQMDLIPSIEYKEGNQILILYVRDVHDMYLKEKRSREAMLDEYHRDALTKLYNRHRYSEDIEELSKGEFERLTVCYADVNGLHELNNQLGHERGDDMLCSVADMLKKYFPDDTVYRIGGDEFVVLSRRLSKQSVEHIVSKVRDELRKDHYEISVGVESGGSELTVSRIVGAAELAMRSDKEYYYSHHGDRRKRRAINEELERTLEQKKYAEQFLKLISDSFNGVYFVNLKEDTLQHIYIPDYFLELVEKADYRYSKAMRLYLEKYVKLEYYEMFQSVLDYRLLFERLERDKVVSFAYQKVDGSTMYLRITRQNDPNSNGDETIWVFSGEEMK